ncbi:hypothetical protein FWK35_00009525, partial [Aphis craccivora]
NRSTFTAPKRGDRHKNIIVKSIHSSLRSESKNNIVLKLITIKYFLHVYYKHL